MIDIVRTTQIKNGEIISSIPEFMYFSEVKQNIEQYCKLTESPYESTEDCISFLDNSNCTIIIEKRY